MQLIGGAANDISWCAFACVLAAAVGRDFGGGLAIARRHGTFPACPRRWIWLLGLMAVLAWISGMINFTGTTAERPFFDAVADAMGDAAVVTDAKGRAVYANAALSETCVKGRGVAPDGHGCAVFGLSGFFGSRFINWRKRRGKGKTMQRDVRVSAGSSVPGADADSRAGCDWACLRSGAGQHEGYTLWRLIDITTDRQHQESAFSRLQFIITYLDHAPAGFFSTLPRRQGGLCECHAGGLAGH